MSEPEQTLPTEVELPTCLKCGPIPWEEVGLVERHSDVYVHSVAPSEDGEGLDLVDSELVRENIDESWYEHDGPKHCGGDVTIPEKYQEES